MRDAEGKQCQHHGGCPAVRAVTLCQLEDVLLPVDDLERALGGHLSYVPCVEPAILVQNLHHTCPSVTRPEASIVQWRRSDDPFSPHPAVGDTFPPEDTCLHLAPATSWHVLPDARQYMLPGSSTCYWMGHVIR